MQIQREDDDRLVAFTSKPALAGGVLIGLGRLLADRADPSKVLAFLDVAGACNPSLALVAAGAIGTALGPMAGARRRLRSWLAPPAQLPTQRQVDARLVGSAFGRRVQITR